MGLAALRVALGFVLVAGTAFGAIANPATDANGMGIDTRIDTQDDGLTVDGDPAGIDPQRVYRRVQALYDASLPAVEANIHQNGGVDLRETHPDQFFALLADPEIRIERRVRGTANEGWVSVSYRSDAPPALVERVFAHELAHAVQPKSLRDDMEHAAGDDADTTDAAMARQAVAEGAAVFVTDVYAARYLDALPQTTRLAFEWPTMTDATRLLWAPYRYGADHVRERADSPATLSTVYENPPMTTEAVLHPSEVGVSPPSLTVKSDALGGLSRVATDTKGELYLRVLLASELAPDRAARAAAGWGTDRLLAYTGQGTDSFAWVLRWDSPEEASQFESAMADYLDATATQHSERSWEDGASAFRLDCPTEETCVLLAGDPEFVDSARIDGNSSNVSITSERSGRVESAGSHSLVHRR